MWLSAWSCGSRLLQGLLCLEPGVVAGVEVEQEWTDPSDATDKTSTSDAVGLRGSAEKDICR